MPGLRFTRKQGLMQIHSGLRACISVTPQHLHQVALGIPVPVYWARLMAKVTGQAAAEKLCLNATLASPQQALELGLVDQACS